MTYRHKQHEQDQPQRQRDVQLRKHANALVHAEVTEMVAIITDSAISAALAAMESGISNSTLRP